jgi:hypothetical protein
MATEGLAMARLKLVQLRCSFTARGWASEVQTTLEKAGVALPLITPDGYTIQDILTDIMERATNNGGHAVEEYVKLVKLRGEVQRAQVAWEQIHQIVSREFERPKDLRCALNQIRRLVDDELREHTA